MAVDYMRFAQLAGAQNPMGEGLASLGQTLQQNESLKRQKMLDQRQMRLSDLQMQQQEAQLADQQAKQGATQQLYGAADPQEAYLKQAQAQQQADLHKKDMEVEKQILDLVGKGKERGLKAEQLNPIIQAWSADIQNPKKKEMYQNLKLNDNWGSTTKIMLDGSEGINHPITGKPLAAGVYQIEFDQNRKPVKVDFVQEMKPDSEALLDKRLAAQAAAQERSIAAADARTAKQIAAADARASRPKPEPPGKVLPAGQVEAIADMKRVKDVLAEAGQIANQKNISTGPVVGRLQSLGSKVGMASDDFTNLNQKLASAENIMLKLRSGAAVTDQEFERFKREFPNVNDPPAVRNRKLSNAIKYANELMDSKIDLYEESGYKVPRSAKSKPAQSQSGTFTTKGGFIVRPK